MRFHYFISVVMLAAGLCLSPSVQAAPDDEIVYEGSDFVIYKSQMAGKEPQMVPFGSPFRHTVFLNFDGATLKQGGNDSRTNRTGLIIVPTLNYPAQDFSGMGGKDKGIKDILTELRMLYMNYAVEFVTTRPTSGDYTMAMIGGNGQGCKGGGGAVGIAPLDCKHNMKNDIVLIFKMKDDAKQLAFVIAHELGHSFGLEHVTNKKDIMYPALNSSTCCWTKSPISGNSFCKRKEQDAKQVLTENLGVGDGDQVPPKAWFVRPGNDAVLPGRFSFEVAAADDLKVSLVELYVDGVKKLTLDSAPFVSYVENLADGEHMISAYVYDFKPNVAITNIKVTVQASCVTEGTCWPGKAGMGAVCLLGADCDSGICATNGVVGHCADRCDPLTKICPLDLTCQAAGGEFACTRGAGFLLDIDEDSGCNLGSEASPGAVILVLLLVVALTARRRRVRQ